jgi:hypothetical protein
MVWTTPSTEPSHANRHAVPQVGGYAADLARVDQIAAGVKMRGKNGEIAVNGRRSCLEEEI